MMTIAMSNSTSSLEFSVDVAMEDIVAKVADGTASDADKAELAQLSARRVRMMRRLGVPTIRRRLIAG